MFSASAVCLQKLKAPWVDECYTYYGIWHDSFSEFSGSILTGINFSPPLYFFLNFIIQLFLPTSIELLRLQSLIWVLIGITISFLLTRKLFGSLPGFLATILVASQSSLLISQSLEARHYSMFFACGAWVLYTQSFNNLGCKKNKWFTFLAHFCLCQVHYLGIIFSALVALSMFICNKDMPLVRRIPFSVLVAWIHVLPIYLFLLSQQSSHLGNWPKPNGLTDLSASYNDSLLILTILIPTIIVLITRKTHKDNNTQLIEEANFSKSTICSALLWFSTPIIFWLLSHLSPLNLFVDRYFIPKESALIFLVAYGFNLIFQKLPQNESMSIPMLGTFSISVVLVLVSAKRAAFGLNKDTNYHHSLIIEESYPNTKQPISLEGDPKYFPNAYLNRNNYCLLIKDEDLIKTYSQFSRKINLVDHKK